MQRHLLLLPCLRLLLTLATTTPGVRAETSCQDWAKMILNKNSPEYVLIPNSDDLNTFTTSRLTINFEWRHIDQLLNKTCVQRYFIEYGPHTLRSSESHHISKRESVSNSAQISPPLRPEEVTFKATLDDDCRVYLVRLVVMLKQGEMLRSHTRLLWPAGHRTAIEPFSDGLLLTWSPVCTIVTKDWHLEVCEEASDASTVNCSNTSPIQGQSQYHLAHLRSCHLFKISVRSVDGNVLWTFEDVQTLPKPKFELRSGHTSMDVAVQQDQCHAEAVVKHWRITYCTHVSPSKKTRQHHVAEEGSGLVDDDLEDDQEEEEYYYYDDKVTTGRCLTQSSTISQDNGVIQLRGLDECTLYSLDLTPVSAIGEALQSSEKFGTIYSTLCGHGRPRDSTAEDDPIWISNDDVFYTSSEEEPHSIGYIVVGAIGGIVLAVCVAVIIWVKTKNKIISASSNVTTTTTTLRSAKKKYDESETSSPRLALLSSS